MKTKAIIGARIVLGLIFFVFGLNGFFNFLPAPPLEGKGLEFIMALANTGYMFPIIKGTEVVAGALLLSGIAVPFALVILAPIALNIFLFHTILAPAPALPLIILALGLFLAWNEKEKFAQLFRK
ncbi:MAG: hypothetical protein V4596_11785 [Bdellovibrionota bacterium]